MQAVPVRRIALTALVVLTALAAPAATAQQAAKRGQADERTEADRFSFVDARFGKARVEVPEPTGKGNWLGSWIYTNRDQRVLMWVREERGKMQYKVRYLKLGALEQFITDWGGAADYTFDGHPGKFRFDLDEFGDDEATGTWDWNLQFSDSSISETANLRLFRTGDGRRMTLVFDPFKREIVRHGQPAVYDTSQIWTFTKVSRRLIDWEELF